MSSGEAGKGCFMHAHWEGNRDPAAHPQPDFVNLSPEDKFYLGVPQAPLLLSGNSVP